MNRLEIKNVIEFALLAAGGPLGKADLRRLFENGEAGGKEGKDGVESVLEELAQDWEGRGMRLARVADGWQFVSREGYMEYLRRLRPQKTARLSKQLMEVLAVVAYRQPATRGDIERIRGVSVSSAQIAALEELGWINEVGRRETPGRPVLYGTTKSFLNDLALSSLDELPELELEDIEAAGEDAEDSADSENFADGENGADGSDNSDGADDTDGGDNTDGADNAGDVEDTDGADSEDSADGRGG